ncbi:hypothetical protein A2U01_0085798 [Trifolium medium]|uniref:Uncharacterized protein n=1 Tax=Trifolium medium TaxID=97028 RepID=A0A392TW67_9FABA|nr:hypothetical protein [Trifolium medium]
MNSEQRFTVLVVVSNRVGCVMKGISRLVLMLAANMVKGGRHSQCHLSLTQLNNDEYCSS